MKFDDSYIVLVAIRTNHVSCYLGFREHGSRPTTAWTGNGSKAIDSARSRLLFYRRGGVSGGH